MVTKEKHNFEKVYRYRFDQRALLYRTEKYQRYKGENQTKSIKNNLDFYKKQIKFYKEKSISSLKKAQQFATDQDLLLLPGKTNIGSTDSLARSQILPQNQFSLDTFNSINIEVQRVAAANTVRLIEEKLNIINDLSEENMNELISIAYTI